jgi:hypothetical protein
MTEAAKYSGLTPMHIAAESTVSFQFFGVFAKLQKSNY